MKRISGWDAAYLYLETAEQSFVVNAILDLDPSGMPGGYSFERAAAELGRRLRSIPELRRTLADSAANLGHPAWVEAFDLRIPDHVHRHDVPYPGERPDVLDLVGELCSRPLDPGRPLWEVHVLEGRRTARSRCSSASTTWSWTVSPRPASSTGSATARTARPRSIRRGCGATRAAVTTSRWSPAGPCTSCRVR